MKEMIHVLETIKNRETIEGFIKSLDSKGCELLVNALRYTDNETESRWLEIYNDTFKY
jgi:hypothetical protein